MKYLLTLIIVSNFCHAKECSEAVALAIGIEEIEKHYPNLYQAYIPYSLHSLNQSWVVLGSEKINGHSEKAASSVTTKPNDVKSSSGTESEVKIEGVKIALESARSIGGGAPEVSINKSNCKVIEVQLSR